MLHRYYLLLILCCCCCLLRAQIVGSHHRLYIGQDSIKLSVFTHTDNGLLFFNMHDDENLCVEQTYPLLQETGGRLLELRHYGSLENKARYISAYKNGKIYTFDPNRIFSDKDSVRAQTLLSHREHLQAENGLVKLSRSRQPTVQECYQFAQVDLKRFADTLIQFIDTSKTRLIVALHNNHSFAPRCDDNCQHRHGSYNLGTYLRHETEENASAEEIYINPRRNLSGFFIVLNHPDFLQTQVHRCNVILQATDSPDDGSLSVYAHKQGLHYINIEAKRDDPTEQQILLQTLSNMLMEWRFERP